MKTTCFLVPTPWQNAKKYIERPDLYKDIIMKSGQYNGYLGIDKDTYNKYIKVNDYDELPDEFPQVHGGVTYLNENEERLGALPVIAVDETFDPNLKDYVVLGFDTCHCDDTYDKWDFKNTRTELLRWRDEVVNWLNEVSANK